MRAAALYRAPSELRVLVVDAALGAMHVAAAADFARLFDRGDLLVVNDAATLPASLRENPRPDLADVEVRLLGAIDDRTWTAALLGTGDWHTPTEDRPAPRLVTEGEELRFGALVAQVVRVHPESPRLVTLHLRRERDASLSALWAELYRVGRPVQYAHVPEAYALWDVQNVYAGRPWAVEMPSAGRILTFAAFAELAHRGVAVATLTHAAGLSSVGDAVIDAMLPLPERYDMPPATWSAVLRTRAAGGRVVAVGTSVVRALESAARSGHLSDTTALRLGPTTQRHVVDGVLTGVHETATSHFALLGAFAPRPILDASLHEAASADLLAHEMGDACLLWGATRALATAPSLGRAPLDGPLRVLSTGAPQECPHPVGYGSVDGGWTEHDTPRAMGASASATAPATPGLLRGEQGRREC